MVFRKKTIDRFYLRACRYVLLCKIRSSKIEGQEGEMGGIDRADRFACARVRAGYRENELRRDEVDRNR